MKRVITTDDEGYKHSGLTIGKGDVVMPNDPPDLSRMDWEEIRKEIHNKLIERNLITLKDIQNPRSGLNNAVLTTIIPRLVGLYKTEEL